MMFFCLNCKSDSDNIVRLLLYCPVPVVAAKLSCRPAPHNCPSILRLLNKEEFYNSKEDQKTYSAIFWKFLASTERFPLLANLVQELFHLMKNPSGNGLTDVTTTERKVKNCLGVPLPFDLKAVFNQDKGSKTLLNIAWCPFFSSCGLMVGSKFGDFHAQMEQTYIDALADKKFDKTYVVLYLDMVWYCKRLTRDGQKSNASISTDEEIDSSVIESQIANRIFLFLPIVLFQVQICLMNPTLLIHVLGLT